MLGGFLAQLADPARHTWFWFFGALFIVGAFLAAAGILRTTMSVIDRGSRLMAAVGIALLLAGAGGAVATAVGAPGSTVAAFKEMVGAGGAASPLPPPKPGAPTEHVVGVDFTFQPDTISVPAGTTVDVVFQNRGQSPHTFTVQAAGFELKTDAGGSASGALKGLKPGRYEFICSIPGHVQLGMTGTLVVR